MLTLVQRLSKLPNRESLSIDEAVASTGLSSREIRQGALPVYMARGLWRVPTAAVRAYLEWQHDGLPPDCLWDADREPAESTQRSSLTSAHAGRNLSSRNGSAP